MRVVCAFLVLAVVLAGAAGPAAADGKFKLTNDAGANAAVKDVDPQNDKNHVILIETTEDYPAGAGAIFLKIKTHPKVADLTNLLSTKYRFEGRTCAGGSPRFQILVESTLAPAGPPFNGRANVFGYLGDKAFGGGCPSGAWTFEDMTNGAPKWELSQFGGGFTATWADVVTFFAADPDHRVVSCGLVDDSGSFAPDAVGVAYYDQVQCYRKTLGNHGDASR
jgi:hypothetical protein